jgi:superfamily II DNA/RNA helicase
MSFLKNVKGAKHIVPTNVVQNNNAAAAAPQPTATRQNTQAKRGIDEEEVQGANESKAKKNNKIRIAGTVPDELKADKVMSTMYAKLGGTIHIRNYVGKQHTKFEELCNKAELIRAFYGVMGWQFPSPIQSIGIQPVVNGRDIICQSQAGTGKTGTYVTAALELVDESIKACQVLILSPTRELTIQTFEVGKKLATYMNVSIALHIGRLQVQEEQQGKKYLHNLKQNSNVQPYTEQIVIATPGRLNKLLKPTNRNNESIDPSEIKLIIIDEADKMLQHGFMSDIVDIFSMMPRRVTEKGQTDVQVALYSATWSDEIKEISKKFMTNPVTILVDQEDVVLENQKQYRVDIKTPTEKDTVLAGIFEMSNIGQVIVFCNRKSTVQYVGKVMSDLKISYGCIHADLTQEERNQTMDQFRNAEIKVLVATDVIARGIDTVVHLVINYDIPQDVEQYVHRIGRTGRFGKEGAALNIVSIEDRPKMIDIISMYKLLLYNYNDFIEDNKKQTEHV